MAGRDWRKGYKGEEEEEMGGCVVELMIGVVFIGK